VAAFPFLAQIAAERQDDATGCQLLERMAAHGDRLLGEDRRQRNKGVPLVLRNHGNGGGRRILVARLGEAVITHVNQEQAAVPKAQQVRRERADLARLRLGDDAVIVPRLAAVLRGF
jgi:hypothetical protein